MRSTPPVYKTVFFGLLLMTLQGLTGCEKALDLKEPSINNVSVFDECWRVVDERYALFSVKQVDWLNVYQQYRSRVNDNLTSAQLYTVLDQMLQELKDGHIALISNTDTSAYTGFYFNYPINFNYANVVNKYLKPDYQQIGPFQLRILDNVSYIYYSSFLNNFTEQELTDLFSAIATTKGLILDVRSNPGGNSRNADKLFSRFISTKQVVKYEVEKNGKAHNNLAIPKPHEVVPTSPGYFKPIIVLTNRSSYSACNDFVLYMTSLANCKTYGDQTGGGGSIPQEYRLANGWRLLVGTTLTLSPSKQAIENGIPAALNIHVTPQDESDGKDPIIEAAFQSLR